MNYRMISYILGWILIFEGLFLSVPMLTAIVYGESVLPSYLIAMGICFLIGGLTGIQKAEKEAAICPRRLRYSCTELDSTQCVRSSPLPDDPGDSDIHRRAL